MYNLEFIRLILAHAEAFDWSLHGFGMFRLYLRRDLRIHVWDSKFATFAVSTIHNHPWDFTSDVIQGMITNVEYDTCIGKATHHIQKIKCGEGGGLVGESNTCCIHKLRSISYTAFNCYSEDSRTLHETKAEDGTVTIIKRFFKADTEHAMVAWPIGQNWVSAEPRPATKSEKLDMRDRALKL